MIVNHDERKLIEFHSTRFSDLKMVSAKKLVGQKQMDV